MKRGKKPGSSRERAFRYVRDQVHAGLPPTVREVQAALGFKAVQSAAEHLDRLVRDGRLVKQPGKARGYALPPALTPSRPIRQVPILGRVHAGQLHEAIEDIEGYVPIHARPSEDLFGLRVQGDSMIEAGILHDDLVIVRRQPTARSGDIVVALVDDEATVKRLRIVGRRIELHPENSRFKPILPNPDACTILGKVIEVQRSLEKKGRPGR